MIVQERNGKLCLKQTRAVLRRPILEILQHSTIPKPILINSGNGIHAYWLFDRTLSRQEWNPLAKRLKQLCKEHGLIVDDKVFEAARVLRPTGSFNFKDKSTPKPVEVWNNSTVELSYEDCVS